MRPSLVMSFQVLEFHLENVPGKKNSLVPRPFSPPVFDRLQYAKTDGGRPRRTSHVRDIR